MFLGITWDHIVIQSDPFAWLTICQAVIQSEAHDAEHRDPIPNLARALGLI